MDFNCNVHSLHNWSVLIEWNVEGVALGRHANKASSIRIPWSYQSLLLLACWWPTWQRWHRAAQKRTTIYVSNMLRDAYHNWTATSWVLSLSRVYALRDGLTVQRVYLPIHIDSTELHRTFFSTLRIEGRHFEAIFFSYNTYIFLRLCSFSNSRKHQMFICALEIIVLFWKHFCLIKIDRESAEIANYLRN